MAVYVIAMMVVIQWVSVSIALTHNGPVEWAKGWTIVECQWKDCNDPDVENNYMAGKTGDTQ